MAKRNYQDVPLAAEQPGPQKALLFELRGKSGTDGGSNSPLSTELFAALTIEEVIRYVRTNRPKLEISEVKVSGEIQVLSSSENLG